MKVGWGGEEGRKRQGRGKKIKSQKTQGKQKNFNLLPITKSAMTKSMKEISLNSDKRLSSQPTMQDTTLAVVNQAAQASNIIKIC